MNEQPPLEGEARQPQAPADEAASWEPADRPAGPAPATPPHTSPGEASQPPPASPWAQSAPGGYTGGDAAAGYSAGYAGGGYAGYGTSVGGGDRAPAPTVTASTIVQLVVSAVLTLTCVLSPIALPSLVLSTMAATRSSRDPAGAARLTTTGWVTMAALSVLAVVAFIVVVVVATSL